MSFERDTRNAQALLHTLALELRHVPVDGQTQAIHVRALQLKRDVTHWQESLAAEARERVLEELSDLCAEAVQWHLAPSGRQLAAALQLARTG